MGWRTYLHYSAICQEEGKGVFWWGETDTQTKSLPLPPTTAPPPLSAQLIFAWQMWLPPQVIRSQQIKKEVEVEQIKIRQYDQDSVNFSLFTDLDIQRIDIYVCLWRRRWHVRSSDSVTGPRCQEACQRYKRVLQMFSGCQTATGEHLRQLRLRLCSPQLLIRISGKEFEKFRR